jgi:ABC-type uncharacterized transport system permease subunit
MEAKFDGDEFRASGDTDTMAAHERIVNYRSKMFTIRVIASYCVSVVFVIVVALLIIFAPENRETAVTVTAICLLFLAAGIAGFTSVKAKTPGGLEASGEKIGTPVKSESEFGKNRSNLE